MAKQLGRSKRLGFSLPKRLLPKRLLPKRLLPRLLIVVTALSALSSLPAKAEALKDWAYDVQTRSLTLSLPDAVTPLVSVIAPNQLLLELPDTQVGTVMSQTVQDGLVERITLEQATPETVWVVMEFVAGTVLSAAQAAVPLAESQSGEQQWQVRPTIAAANRVADQDVSQDIGEEIAPSEDVSAASTSASSLQIPAAEISQLPNFSDLPVLEPSAPLNQPVSVPALDTVTPTALPQPSFEPSSEPVADIPVSESPSEPPSQAAVAEDSLPFPSAAVDGDSALAEPAPIADADSPASASPISTASDPLSDPLALDPPFIDAADPSSDEPTLVEGVPEVPEAIAADPASAIPALDDRIASEPDVLEMTTEPESVTDSQITDNQADSEPLADETIRPSRTSRWPEPIPFGQPLPR